MTACLRLSLEPEQIYFCYLLFNQHRNYQCSFHFILHSFYPYIENELTFFLNIYIQVLILFLNSYDLLRAKIQELFFY